MANTRQFSSRQEKKVAKDLNGRVVANSGATLFKKGDVNLGNILCECKTCMTPKMQFTIKKDWLTKNRQEAFAMNKDYSVLAFNFGPDQENYFIIDENLMEMLTDLVNHKNQ